MINLPILLEASHNKFFGKVKFRIRQHGQIEKDIDVTKELKGRDRSNQEDTFLRARLVAGELYLHI